MSETIKVMTFNIEFCASVNSGYWQYIEYLWKYLLPHRITAIYEIIDIVFQEEIDVAMLTEMEGASRRTHHRDYLDMILKSTMLKNSVFYPVTMWRLDMGNRGNAIATKYEIIESKNVKLKTILENRYLSIAKLKIGTRTVHILTTQLSLGKGSRTKQLKQIIEIINNISGPIIFGGDLNTDNKEELDALKNTRLKRIETTNTFPSWNPQRRIDYIFHSPEFVVVNSYVLDKSKVSDHLPVVAELKLIDDSKNRNIGKKSVSKHKTS